jgi:hypothetical protein
MPRILALKLSKMKEQASEVNKVRFTAPQVGTVASSLVLVHIIKFPTHNTFY